jgi:hypothetical protein
VFRTTEQQSVDPATGQFDASEIRQKGERWRHFATKYSEKSHAEKEHENEN